MRRLNLISVCAMALFLGTIVASAGCGDDGGGEGGGGSSPTTSSSSSSGGGGGQGGGGQGGAGGQGEGGGTGGQGGAGECVTCFRALTSTDPVPDDQLCPGTKEKLDTFKACACMACGAAEGDVCYASCNMMGPRTPECATCGTMAGTAADGACKMQGDACIGDMGM